GDSPEMGLSSRAGLGGSSGPGRRRSPQLIVLETPPRSMDYRRRAFRTGVANELDPSGCRRRRSLRSGRRGRQPTLEPARGRPEVIGQRGCRESGTVSRADLHTHGIDPDKLQSVPSDRRALTARTSAYPSGLERKTAVKSKPPLPG